MYMCVCLLGAALLQHRYSLLKHLSLNLKSRKTEGERQRREKPEPTSLIPGGPGERTELQIEP